jgi:hypothetical protein
VNGKIKVPVPKYRYKLITVSSSEEANRMEKELRKHLDASGLSFYAVCHTNGECDVMGDAGTVPMEPAALRNARAVAAGVVKA